MSPSGDCAPSPRPSANVSMGRELSGPCVSPTCISYPEKAAPSVETPAQARKTLSAVNSFSTSSSPSLATSLGSPLHAEWIGDLSAEHP